MSNKQEDIVLRIQADYAAAIKSLQQFIGAATKELDKAPKLFQQIEKSVDSLTGKIDKVGQSRGPDELYKDLNQLPDLVRQLTGSIEGLTGKVDKLGSTQGTKQLSQGLREANTQASALSRTFDTLKASGKAIGAAMVGFQAGKMVVQPHMDRMLSYDDQLSHLVNVGLSDKSVAERIAGKNDFNRLIMDSIRVGGGTREQGVETLSKIMGSGVISDKDAKTMLPSVLRGATAANADAGQIADIGIRAMQNFGFKAEDLPRVLDMAIKSGNMGGFELKDMAKWLPAQKPDPGRHSPADYRRPRIRHSCRRHYFRDQCYGSSDCHRRRIRR